MKCSIMQPTYLPWLGYFNLIASVDAFVFFDDVQFSKGSWHNRNRVLTPGGVRWITVPVKQHYQQEIHNVQIVNPSNWKNKQLNLLTGSYSQSRYFDDIQFLLKTISEFKGSSLCELNIALICEFAKKLDLKCKFYRASSLDVFGDRTQRLVDICKTLNCDVYISPAGAREYLLADGDFELSGIDLRFQNYVPHSHAQIWNNDLFISHLSMVDAIANVGIEVVKEYVDKGNGANESDD